ncbi:DUF6412 domain-containing protein [Streptomyces sp. NPDC006743]|uniref:DUF6412 domain-containing protein n=1 Tax=unclassified Streptomyces TaxID=2593676 RepID=UPI00068B5448|nr:DUF6412 domain-containing protein [Streptomyces sp. NRRL S-340]
MRRVRHRLGAPLAPVLGSLLVLALLVLQLSLLDTGSLSVTVAAGAAFVACALLGSRCAPAVAPTRVRTAMRERDRRTAFLPQRDPDAAGRRRPRAPGRALPATAAA